MIHSYLYNTATSYRFLQVKVFGGEMFPPKLFEEMSQLFSKQVAEGTSHVVLLSHSFAICGLDVCASDLFL